MLKRIIVGAGIAGLGWGTYVAVRRWRATWGVDLGEAARPLPGDDLVPAAMSSDTRGITIEAPAELVWPWLIQMGYGRGGWYSIDQLDMRGSSADHIVEEWQTLAVDDVIPTHPGGGFAVRVLEPGRALVLYADTATMQPTEAAEREAVPAGLAASGAFMSATPRQFAASWAFVVEPLDARRTRLIERVRYWGEEGSPVTKVALSALGFGVFVMLQRQMVGIRTRAERLAAERSLQAADVSPSAGATARSTGNGHAPELKEFVGTAEQA
jgi:hypothetical protein